MNPIRPTDNSARDLARRLLADMRHATLAVLDPDTGHPHLSRIACQIGPDGAPLALLSGLAAHSRALIADPRAALLVDAPPGKGDPLTHPRLSVQVIARRIDTPNPDLRDRWLAAHPRAAVFIDLPDFRFWHLTPQSALLNAGFGAAFRLIPADMATPPQG
ncbi:MAG: pyridoxamine 5'-phosphate oxidase family protein [Paracoccus sp. (in: a-proteobacteria)]|uniref:HugZ family pyridoxamine 5'-phosphate oxidase n=1 Tax=Paracoccus sp. TaxID=267 RepID=UPI0026DF60E9|nr:pyridoxamine 5'-phosphate oxidase family protein [Paracoccus sp. (in: a-proteobacteria)]MDO5631066.1 pyridoxamine 5'-phosphate oxidase family protein [Paracoccus sp. (in: a-proteobacteria)]